MGDRVSATIGWLPDGQTAVLEMAQASGLPLVRGALDPLRATSRGRLLLRIIAMCFDRYLTPAGDSAQPRYSRTV